jgi:hypothetical protein
VNFPFCLTAFLRLGIWQKQINAVDATTTKFEGRSITIHDRPAINHYCSLAYSGARIRDLVQQVFRFRNVKAASGLRFEPMI